MMAVEDRRGSFLIGIVKAVLWKCFGMTQLDCLCGVAIDGREIQLYVFS